MSRKDVRHDVNRPVWKTFAGRQFIHGGGVAIFHIKSARVVVVHHTKEDHYFLPKGRKDIGEDSITGAEREGFEETGFRNRVLPLPLPTVQTRPLPIKQSSSLSSTFHTEPILTSLFPMGRHGQIQYIASWYIAETLPPALEATLNAATSQAASTIAGSNTNPTATFGSASNTTGLAAIPPLYQRPSPSPPEQTLDERMAMEPEGWGPTRQELSTTQSDELFYEARLMGIEEAIERLKGTGLEEIVREGWRIIQERLRLEREEGGGG